MLRKKIKVLICISFIKASRKAEDFNKTKVKKTLHQIQTEISTMIG